MHVPVSNAEVAVVAQRALVGSLPCNGGFGAAAHFTPQCDTLTLITGHITQWNEHLWRNWTGKNEWDDLKFFFFLNTNYMK